MRIRSKYRNLVFSICMALSMSFCMSLVLSVINIGIIDNFVVIWSKSWMTSFAIALPITLLVPKLINFCMDGMLKFYE